MGTYTSQRQPIEPAVNGGITMREIEDCVEDLNPRLSLDDRRAASLLFAILKQGSSVQKIQWFTSYDREFIDERVEWLRTRGLLFTGTLSTQYVLGQVPGSEDLIERITGQRIMRPEKLAPPAPAADLAKNLIRPAITRVTPVPIKPIKEEEFMDARTAVNGAAEIKDFQQACTKTPGCPRKDRHTGRCAGAEGKPRRLQADSPEERRAANAARMRAARAENKGYARGPKAAPAAAPAVKPAAKADPGHFKIEFEDAEDTITREGHGREGFARALKALYQEFAGE